MTWRVVTKGNIGPFRRGHLSVSSNQGVIGARFPPQRRAAEGRREWRVLFFSWEPAERDAQRCPRVQHSHAPEFIQGRARPHTHPNPDAGCEFKFTHPHAHTQHPLLLSHILMSQICVYPQRAKKRISFYLSKLYHKVSDSDF